MFLLAKFMAYIIHSWWPLRGSIFIEIYATLLLSSKCGPYSYVNRKSYGSFFFEFITFMSKGINCGPYSVLIHKVRVGRGPHLPMGMKN